MQADRYRYLNLLGHPVNSRCTRSTFVVFVPSRGALPSVPARSARIFRPFFINPTAVDG
jgi:hypothetical protein